MCCLFGMIEYKHLLSSRQKTRLVRALAAASEARGTDAAGIAYNSGGRLHIYKRPGPAHRLQPLIPWDACAVMGHTRMTTQGNAKYNKNNHPFVGSVPGTRFALAHNGVLCNDKALRRRLKLPKTSIETDSYIAVQLLEKEGTLTPDSLQYMAEQVEGSFVFTVLDQRDTLSIVKGDNPLCLLHYPRLGLYVYASTEAILVRALQTTWLADEPSTEIPTWYGDILSIDREGRMQTDRFAPEEWSISHWSQELSPVLPRAAVHGPESWYLGQLKSVAAGFGYMPEVVDMLLREGWSTDEIEDALYCQDGL